MLLAPDGKTILRDFATTTMGLQGMFVFTSIHMSDVTSIEWGVRVLVDVTHLFLLVFFLLCFLCGCGLVIILLFDMYLFCFALQLQLECDPLGFPQALHRKVGMGASGANQLPDPANPRLYQTFITFSLDIRPLLAQGKIVPGLGVRCKPRQAAEDHDSWELWGDDDIYSSDDSDALYYEEDDIYSSEDSDASYCEESDDDSFQDPGYSRQHSDDRGCDASGAQATSAAEPGAASNNPYVVD